MRNRNFIVATVFLTIQDFNELNYQIQNGRRGDFYIKAYFSKDEKAPCQINIPLKSTLGTNLNQEYTHIDLDILLNDL